MPVIAMAMGERPNDSVPSQPLGDGGVLVNISVIVIVDEFMVPGLAKNGPHRCSQEKAYDNRQPVGAWRGARREGVAA